MSKATIISNKQSYSGRRNPDPHSSLLGVIIFNIKEHGNLRFYHTSKKKSKVSDHSQG